MEEIIKILKEFKDLAETMADWEIINYQEEKDELKKAEKRGKIKAYYQVSDIIQTDINSFERIKEWLQQY